MITHLTASLSFRSMELTITSSTSRTRGPKNERKNVAAAEEQEESMAYRLTQERGRWPFLTPRLENVTDKTRECSTTGEAYMGVSGGTAGSSKKERDDGEDNRHGSKQSDYWKLLEGACEGRTEDSEVTRDLEILESMLGKEVHEQSVLCGEHDLRGVRAGTLDYANQPPTGFVLGKPQVPV